MSANILRKSLALCDPDLQRKQQSKKVSKKEKLKARVSKLSKEHILQSNRKHTINEAQKSLKVRKEVIKERLTLLKSSKIQLNEEITQQIIERAVTRKPIQSKPKEIVEEKSAFTEEDFKKFEQEYFDE